MTIRIVPVLWFDVQSALPRGFCPVCGAERYAQEPCPRCERRKP